MSRLEQVRSLWSLVEDDRSRIQPEVFVRDERTSVEIAAVNDEYRVAYALRAKPRAHGLIARFVHGRLRGRHGDAMAVLGRCKTPERRLIRFYRRPSAFEIGCKRFGNLRTGARLTHDLEHLRSQTRRLLGPGFYEITRWHVLERVPKTGVEDGIDGRDTGFCGAYWSGFWRYIGSRQVLRSPLAFVVVTRHLFFGRHSSGRRLSGMVALPRGKP